MTACVDSGGVNAVETGDAMLRTLAALTNPHRLRVVAALAGGRNREPGQGVRQPARRQTSNNRF
jgi:hypothetical protein